MEIETFEIEDASSEASQMANDATALELIEQLGLDGQKKLSNKDTLTRVAYQEMTREEFFVYKALFTKTSTIRDYSAGVIPVRVLQVAAHAMNSKMFLKLEVWYPETARVDDPVLAGFIGPNEYTGQWYKLARWGKALLPFDKLMAEALEVRRVTRADKLNKILEEVKAALAVNATVKSYNILHEDPYVGGIS
jgi:hypothetical protein